MRRVWLRACAHSRASGSTPSRERRRAEPRTTPPHPPWVMTRVPPRRNGCDVPVIQGEENDEKEPDVHGPVDFVLLEFPRTTGSRVAPLTSCCRSSTRGSSPSTTCSSSARTRPGRPMAWTSPKWPPHSGSVVRPAGRGPVGASYRRGHAPGGRGHGARTTGALIVYENTWAIPFVAAARESGGELIAGARSRRRTSWTPWTHWSPGTTHHLDELRSRNAWITARSGTDGRSSPGQPPQSAVACNADRRADSPSRDAQIAADRNQAYEAQMAPQQAEYQQYQPAAGALRAPTDSSSSRPWPISRPRESSRRRSSPERSRRSSAG